MGMENFSEQTSSRSRGWVCLPKENGGMGVRDCIAWNVVVVGKYVWQVARKEDLLWIKWVHHMYIKDNKWW